MNTRNTFKYHFKIKNKIVHSGITNDLERREQEHRGKWANGHISKVGYKTTKPAALEWERQQDHA